MDKKLGKLIADVWEDRRVEDRLKADPVGVLTEYGVEVPPGREVIPLFATDDVTYVVLPSITKMRERVIPIRPLLASPGQDPLALVIAAKAAGDACFRDLLLRDVRSALEEVGLSVPESHEVRVVANDDSKIHFVIPAPPKVELTQEELEKIAGGSSTAQTTNTMTTEETTTETTQTLVEETTQISTEETTAETTAEAVAEAVTFIIAT